MAGREWCSFGQAVAAEGAAAAEVEDSLNTGSRERHLNISNSSLVPASPSVLALLPQVTPRMAQDTAAVAGAAAEVEKAEETETAAEAKEESEGYEFWHRLPDLVLSHVMSYLDDVDRCNASLVCTSWRRAFSNPALWRERHFVFRGYKALEQSENYQKFLGQLGRYMHSMSLQLCRPNVSTASIIAKAFEQFANALNRTSGVRLLHISLSNIDFHASWHFYSHNRGIVIRALCNLLKKQINLRSVDLSYCLMDRDEGTRLLSALSYGTRLHPKKYLEDVDMRQFFTTRTRAVSFVRYGKVMGQFPALVTLKMDMRGLSVAILQTLAQASSKTLRNLELDYTSDESLGDQAITSECWRAVAVKLPALRVKIRIRGLCVLQKYLSVLVRGLPLSEIQVSYLGVENLRNPALLTAVPILLGHLASAFHATLLKVHLQLSPEVDPEADAAVVGLIRNCPQLREVYFNMVLQARTVLQILEAIHMQRSMGGTSAFQVPAMKTRFHLNVRGMTPELDLAIQQMTSSGGFSDVTTMTLPPLDEPAAAAAVEAIVVDDDEAAADEDVFVDDDDNIDDEDAIAAEIAAAVANGAGVGPSVSAMFDQF